MRLLINFHLIQITLFHIQQSHQFQTEFLTRKVQDAAVFNEQVEKIRRRGHNSDNLRRYMFFDKIKQAFENDPNDFEAIVGKKELEPSSPRTQVQQQWIDSAGGRKINAPIPSALLAGTKWSLELFLAGTPDRDPANNLYGSRVNISSRDSQLGLGVNCPEEPSIVITIEFDNDGGCRSEKSAFTTGATGLYKVEEKGNKIRFSIDTSGFTRTVQTTGTITKIFWSETEGVTRNTQSTYSIPPGYIYADTIVRYGRIPGTFEMEEGLLRVEEKSGLFGVSSKMIACGKFRANFISSNA